MFSDFPHAIRVIGDPDFNKAWLALGANKGLIGAALFMTGPTVFDMRVPVRTLADLKGKKIRVLASPFQMDQLKAIGATGVPLSLGDVLPALQQGALDGAMGALPVFSALQYQDTAKYMVETGQSFIFSQAVLSKRWFDGLPADLQADVMSTSREAAAIAIPLVGRFPRRAAQGVGQERRRSASLPAADHAELMAKMAPVGDDIVKAKPELKPMWDLLVAAVKRTSK